jgi:hypothetical protein
VFIPANSQNKSIRTLQAGQGARGRSSLSAVFDVAMKGEL